MLQLSINGTIAGRFKSQQKLLVQEYTLTTSILDNGVYITYRHYDNWEDAYNDFITTRQQAYMVAFRHASENSQVTSINGLSDSVFILAGRGFAMDIEGTTLKFSNTMYNTDNSRVLSTLINNDSNRIIMDYIFRYQMCLYHYYNTLLARSLRNNMESQGFYYRYMGARARWNNFVYTSCINRNVLSSGDTIFITLGFNNMTDADETVKITVTVKPKGTHKNLIWYGVFLEEVSPRTANVNEESSAEEVFNYTITRNGTYKKLSDEYFNFYKEGDDIGTDETIDADKEVALAKRVWVHDPATEGTNIDPNNPADASAFTTQTAPTDITNPNNCVWSIYGGEWTEATIQQECVLQAKESFKYVYTVSKHPSVSGYTKRSDKPLLFDIIITYEWSAGTSTKTYNSIPCYMQEHTTDIDAVNQGNEKRYILVANDEMGEYLEPPTS